MDVTSDMQSDAGVLALAAALADDPVGAGIFTSSGGLLWANDAAGGDAADMWVRGPVDGIVTTAIGPCRVTALSGGAYLVRGPLGDGLAGVVHDLRIPLQALAAAAETVASRDDARHLGRIAQDVLARMDEILTEASGPRAVQKVFAPADAIARVIEVVRPLATARGNTLDLRVDPSLMIWGDPRDFAAVVQNLVGNAIKYTEQGGVRVILEAEGRDVLFRVQDDGPGLPAEVARFLRCGAMPEGDHIHGLSIVRARAARLGGTVRHADGGGTRIEVRFVGSAGKGAILPPCDVLIVEDNAVNAGIFAGAVRDIGGFARIVARGDDALAALRGESCGAVLLDVSLPDIDGPEVARGIRAEYPDLPILGITGHSGRDVHDACLKAGMSAVLTKPVRLSDLKLSLLQLVGADAPLVDEALGQELASDLGADVALGFQRRALAEVEALHSALARGDEDLAEMLHSAVGAAGMTGLVGVERELRRLQPMIKSGTLHQGELTRLGAIFRRSRTMLDRVGDLSHDAGSDTPILDA